MLVVISNILAIYRKELQGYFASPLAYAITGIFWLLAGYFLVVFLQPGRGPCRVHGSGRDCRDR
ncbi:MAG: hypothetical protein F6K34_16640, partial [Okeania sp. SIO4D6]|nr:hypothetical protein [Okeania sp. SIO4D6]